MQRSSDSIGALAAALAKAQSEIENPEKSLMATIISPFPREGSRTFRYAPLSSGLDLVRKCLGRHEIATVQTTAIDPDHALIRLTTTLVHASGEWVSSDWPVCPVSETAAPHRLGAALTYARRYALFTLVGIAGEDDLDAPDLPSTVGPFSSQDGPQKPDRSLGEPSRSRGPSRPAQSKQRAAHAGRATSDLSPDASEKLRLQLLSELEPLNEPDELATWAQRALPLKDRLCARDAQTLEKAFAATLARLDELEATPERAGQNGQDHSPAGSEQHTETVKVIAKPVRERDRNHLRFVASQPCLICGRSPSDAHHLKFAEAQAMGRKVSDRFTVPICRLHHRELHRRGDERAWWESKDIAPLAVAATLWESTHALCSADNHAPEPDVSNGKLNGRPFAEPRGDETKPISRSVAE